MSNVSGTYTLGKLGMYTAKTLYFADLVTTALLDCNISDSSMVNITEVQYEKARESKVGD